jgi:hypothetical protein
MAAMSDGVDDGADREAWPLAEEAAGRAALAGTMAALMPDPLDPPWLAKAAARSGPRQSDLYLHLHPRRNDGTTGALRQPQGNRMSNQDNNAYHQKIAAMASGMTEVYMDALRDPELDANWRDVCFAASIAMKGLASIWALRGKVSEEQALDELRSLFARAMQQPVVTKRFTSKADMDAWLATKGLQEEMPPPREPRH